VVLTTCLGAFAGQVDASIVQLGLPALEEAFDTRLDVVGWVAIAYSLAFAAALPVYARLAEMGGRKTMYVAGFALFGLFSALCGFAPGLGWLIVFRALQGLSGALLGANSVVILVAAAGPERRGRAMGIFAAAQAVGVCAGPALGGLLLAVLSWHWIFWVTVPFAGLGALLGWILVPDPRAPATRKSFDWQGAALLVPCLAALLLGISKVHAWGPGSPAFVSALVLVTVLAAGFVLRERRAPAPLLDLGLFRSAAFSAGTLAVLLSYAMLYGLFFAMSFALVRGTGESALSAGLHLAVVPVALGLLAPFAGDWADRRPRTVMVTGMALCVAGLLLLSVSLTGDTGSAPAVMAALALYGAGLGCFIAPNNSATLKAAPPEHAGQAGGLLNLMRAFGTAAGVASMSSLLSWRLAAAGAETGTHHVSREVLLGAVLGSLPLLVAMALLAACAAMFQGRGAAPTS
jgi:EmrB/QacA subfamily drug resistance transporter